MVFNQRTQRLVALLILGGGLVAIVLFTVLPVMSMHQYYDAEIETTMHRLNKYLAIVSQRDVLEKRLKSVSGVLTDNQYLLKSTIDAMAIAQISELVQQVIKSHRAELITTRTINAKAEKEVFQRASITVEIRTTIDALQKIIHQLEMHKPLLFLDDLTIKVRHHSTSAKQQSGKNNLMVHFQVSAYRNHTSSK